MNSTSVVGQNTTVQGVDSTVQVNYVCQYIAPEINIKQGATNIPIDIIGYSSFDIAITSKKDLDQEDFQFDIVNCPSDWQNMDITQR